VADWGLTVVVDPFRSECVMWLEGGLKTPSNVSKNGENGE